MFDPFGVKNISPDRELNISQMVQSNYERLIRLAEEVFDFRNDPDQLNVDQKAREKLLEIHPATLSEFSDENGPVAWLLIIPTSARIMEQFLAGRISENELFQMTMPGEKYEAVYLCSALVLEEYRRKGIITELALKAITAIRKDHPVKALFVWAFTREGNFGAEKLATITGLPLFHRT